MMRTTISFLITVLVHAGCGGGGGLLDRDAGPDAPPQCALGDASQCDGDDRLECGADGRWAVAEQCSNMCAQGLGCVLCQPFQAHCAGDVASTCRADGSGYEEELCDPMQGLTCDPSFGCRGPCARDSLGSSYIGCEYYPTISANMVDPLFEFAIAVSNTTSEPATIHIEGGGLETPRTFIAAPGNVAIERLPWIPELRGCSSGIGQCLPSVPSSLVRNGAYHLRSDQPVTVYQFSPLDYFSEVARPQYSYTNDASLLLPVNVMGDEYYVASYRALLTNQPSVVTITAIHDDTEVTLTPTASSDEGSALPALEPGVPSAITLDAGDVAQFYSYTGDFTGTHVVSTRPVQVIGGHACAMIPYAEAACDHLEESMFPLETLGADYVVNAPAVPTLPGGKVRVVRIIATAPNTTVTYDPPQPDMASILALPGDMIEVVHSRESFRITADEKILVVQYMEGHSVEGDIGDPAMAQAVPIDQYRLTYQFHAPQNYASNYVDVIAPVGATITLDGTALSGLIPIGTSGYALVRQLLPSTASGNYRIEGSEPFGITVYGYGDHTSYWYPGGLDLAPILLE